MLESGVVVRTPSLLALVGPCWRDRDLSVAQGGQRGPSCSAGRWVHRRPGAPGRCSGLERLPSAAVSFEPFDGHGQIAEAGVRRLHADTPLHEGLRRRMLASGAETMPGNDKGPHVSHVWVAGRGLTPRSDRRHLPPPPS